MYPVHRENDFHIFRAAFSTLSFKECQKNLDCNGRVGDKMLEIFYRLTCYSFRFVFLISRHTTAGRMGFERDGEVRYLFIYF